MGIEMITELMQVFDASGIQRMRVQCQDLVLEMDKGGQGTAAPVQAVTVAPAASTPTQGMALRETVTETPVAMTGTEVKAPIVGVFYPANAPEAKPFVTVGQRVQKGQPLCIIEAMKVMNEVLAPCDGVMAEIRVAREELVAYGQVMMVIAED